MCVPMHARTRQRVVVCLLETHARSWKKERTTLHNTALPVRKPQRTHRHTRSGDQRENIIFPRRPPPPKKKRHRGKPTSIKSTAKRAPKQPAEPRLVQQWPIFEQPPPAKSAYAISKDMKYAGRVQSACRVERYEYVCRPGAFVGNNS